MNNKFIDNKLKEFDRWFNHGTKKDPCFPYASKVYGEVVQFIKEALLEQREEIIEKLFKSLDDEMYQIDDGWGISDKDLEKIISKLKPEQAISQKTESVTQNTTMYHDDTQKPEEKVKEMIK